MFSWARVDSLLISLLSLVFVMMYPVFAFCNELIAWGRGIFSLGIAWYRGRGMLPGLFATTLALSSHYQPLLDLTVTPKAQILLLEGRDTGTVPFKSLGTTLN